MLSFCFSRRPPDGYGNAQAARDWAATVSADLAGLIATHPAQWLASQLPVWAARCASLDGSADDTTLALLLAPSGGRREKQNDGPVQEGATGERS